MVLGGVGTFLFLIAFCFLAVGTLALFGGPDKNILMFPCVNWPRVFICLNKSSTF